MYKKIINNTIEIEWNGPVSTNKFEGDDVWNSDINGDVCSLILVLTGKEETGSNFLKMENPYLNPSGQSHVTLKEQYPSPESERQYFSDDTILFDYRTTPANFDLNNLKSQPLNSNVTLFLNDDRTVEFLLLTGIHSFDFYPNSPKDGPFKLTDLESSVRKQFWNFYSMSCLYQYDCSLNEYKVAVLVGEDLLKKNELPKSICKFIETTIEFWEEIIDEDFGE